MIDEARRITPARGIDHCLVVDGEQHRMRRMLVLDRVTPVSFVVRDAFAEILHETRAFGYIGQSKNTTAMNFRSADAVTASIASISA
jgi:hypothetical protein